jgi:enamine deaminase RidA (YjgF/YER057c/UK114 family)
MKIEERLKELKITLPAAPKPAGSYHPAVIAGNQAFLSGQISRAADGSLITGKVGSSLNLEQGKEAARTAALNVLAVIQAFIGFDRVEKFLRVSGFVQAAPDFYEISQVMNGASDLFLEVFGEKGIHARSAVGMASLPLNAAVEIEVTLLLK